MKISEVLEKFLLDQEVRGNSKQTIRHYKTHIGFFIKYFGDKDINKITYSVYENYIINLRNKFKESSGFVGKKENLSGRTIKTYASALKTFLTYAYENEFLNENVSAKIKMPRYKKKVIQILNNNEINTIINSFDNSYIGYRDLLVILLMLESGLRLSEVVKIRLLDLDFERNIIKVDGKGQKERIVPLTPYTKNIIEKYLDSHYRLFNIKFDVHTQLIRNINGENVTKNTISLIFRRLRKKTNINIHPHLLRHTFATLFLINGGDIANLQIILGHTTLNMVLNYLHLANQLNISIQSKYSPLENIQNPISHNKKIKTS